MPYKSKSQVRAFFAKEEAGELPEGTAMRWAHHTKNIKKLPEHVKKKGEDLMAELAQALVAAADVTKFAADCGLMPAAIQQMAGVARLTPIAFCKAAEDDPLNFLRLTELVLGRDQAAATTERIKAAAFSEPVRPAPTKQATELVLRVMKRAVATKQAALAKQEAAEDFISFLDKTASYLPAEKQVPVRTLQRAVAAGEPLSAAIKLAYPRLTGEQRGILAVDLVKAAASSCSKSMKKKKRRFAYR